MPDYSLDFSLQDSLTPAGYRAVGIDEVGRGPLLGPVVVAAVALPRDCPAVLPFRLTDSKKLSARQRRQAYDWILAHCDYRLAAGSARLIDQINVLQATYAAMRRAATGFGAQEYFALVDGHRLPPGLSLGAQAVVKGDARCPAIAAASILAKVVRDDLLTVLDRRYPGYALAQNAGYPTAAHRQALAKLGPCPHHRRSFGPVAAQIAPQP